MLAVSYLSLAAGGTAGGLALCFAIVSQPSTALTLGIVAVTFFLAGFVVGKIAGLTGRVS